MDSPEFMARFKLALGIVPPATRAGTCSVFEPLNVIELSSIDTMIALEVASYFSPLVSSIGIEPGCRVSVPSRILDMFLVELRAGRVDG
jgi:hypothetical protein